MNLKRIPSLLPLLVFGCATSGHPLPTTAIQCESFVEFDLQVRRELDVLLEKAPGEVLVTQTSRLNAARRTCARQVLGKLQELRETNGLERIQRELNALSATYGPDALRTLMNETLGDDAAPLQPLVLEAQQLAPIEPAIALSCHEPTACEQTRCLVQQSSPAWEGAARKCLDKALAEEPLDKARQVAALVEMLPEESSPVRTEALIQLETLRAQLWPEIERAASARQLGRAAQLASPFQNLPAVATKVADFRKAARAHHVARARAMAGAPLAQWLHLKLAAEFGEAEGPSLPETGTWGPVAWRCAEPMPTLPLLPPGMRATLGLRCEVLKKKLEQDDSMRTFELESALQSQRVNGSLTVTCADKTSQYEFVSIDLLQELQSLITRAHTDCANIHRLASMRSCAALSKSEPGGIISRFVEHARVNRFWEPCFVEWLVANEGVRAPEIQ